MILKSLLPLVSVLVMVSCGGQAGGARTPTSATPQSVPATPNRPPTIGAISVAPLINQLQTALMGATNLTFSVANAADPDGDPLTFAWNFGDGVTGQGNGAKHVYNAGGGFTARVTVSDGRGASVDGTTSVRVATLNGTWDGQLVRTAGSALRAARFTLVVTHSGSALTGSWTDDGGASNRFAPGFLKDPFSVSFSCESCPSNDRSDLIVTGQPVTLLSAPTHPGFDDFNSISGSCTASLSCGTYSSFSMTRR